MDETTNIITGADFPRRYGADPVRFSGHPDALLNAIYCLTT
jgi:hypothetical protein